MTPHRPAKAYGGWEGRRWPGAHWACAPAAEPAGKPSALRGSLRNRDGNLDFMSQHSWRYQEGGAVKGTLKDFNSQHASQRASSPIMSLAGSGPLYLLANQRASCALVATPAQR